MTKPVSQSDDDFNQYILQKMSFCGQVISRQRSCLPRFELVKLKLSKYNQNIPIIVEPHPQYTTTNTHILNHPAVRHTFNYTTAQRVNCVTMPWGVKEGEGSEAVTQRRTRGPKVNGNKQV